MIDYDHINKLRAHNMKKLIFTTLMLPFVLAYAKPDLSTQRITTIQHYLDGLTSNNKDVMASVFVDSGIAYSTSEGRKMAAPFFQEIIPYIGMRHARITNSTIALKMYLLSQITQPV